MTSNKWTFEKSMKKLTTSHRHAVKLAAQGDEEGASLESEFVLLNRDRAIAAYNAMSTCTTELQGHLSIAAGQGQRMTNRIEELEAACKAASRIMHAVAYDGGLDALLPQESRNEYAKVLRELHEIIANEAGGA